MPIRLIREASRMCQENRSSAFSRELSRITIVQWNLELLYGKKFFIFFFLGTI